MTISFNEISANDRVPRSLTEVTRKGPAGVEPKRVVLIGHRLSTGSVGADTIFDVLGEADADTYAGQGSQLAEMCRAFKRVNRSASVSAIGLADDGSGTAAAGQIVISGTASQAGAIEIWIGGRRYVQGVALNATAATVASALKATIEADGRRAVSTGTLSTATFPVTCRWKGSSGNALAIEVVASVPGLTVTPTQLSAGATPPSVTAAIGALGATQFDTIVLGLNDDATLGEFEAEMARRFTAGVELDGLVHTAVGGDATAARAFVSDHNSKHVVVLATGPSATPFWLWSSQAAAREALAIESDGGAIVVDVSLPDCRVPKVGDQLDPDERNTLLSEGVSTYYVGSDGLPYVENLVTTYTTDALGQADETFAPARTMRIIAEYRRLWKRRTSRFRSYKLVADGTPLKPGVKALTPGYGKAEVDSFYEDYAGTGNVEDVEHFTANSHAEKNASNKNRLDTYHPITIGGRVITIASLLEIG